MKMKLQNKLLSLLLAAMLLAAPVLPAAAAHVSAWEAIGALETLELVRGDGSGFAPERGATRAEALVLLLRLLGLEDAALAENNANPYADKCWADAYIGYARKHGLVFGVDERRFGADSPVGARDYVTMTLRAMGYRDGEGGFTWADSLGFADRVGLTNGEYGSSDLLVREDLALISYTALTLPLADGGMTLIEKLYLDGKVSAEALKQTRMADAVYAGRPRYTTAELYERCASASFFMKTYDQLEDFSEDGYKGRSSGFFITEDGLALLSAHQLNSASFALVTTTDDHSYPVTEVLYFDPMQDIALVRVSMTDIEGNTLRRFPWIPLGDSDAVCVGEEIVTISNPEGHRTAVSEGVISEKNTVVDDPDCLKLMNTAPISFGSSGGVLLNRWGDAIGVVFGSFLEGDSLYLATPVNSLDRSAMRAQGKPLETLREEQDERKRAARFWLEGGEEALTLTVGEQESVVICSDWPGQAGFRYDIDDVEVAECEWGDFLTRQSVELYVMGLEEGETVVRITYPDEINDFELEIPVTVLPAADTETEAETEAEAEDESE